MFRKSTKNGLLMASAVVVLSMLLLPSRLHAFSCHAPRSQWRLRATQVFHTARPTSSKTDVIFSKVVRPVPDQQPYLFLPQLVEYLQDKFRLPPNLPMTYESVQDDRNDNVVSWYSPLSSTADETRLSVQVVPIHTAESDDGAFPSMAMVAVHKEKGKTINAPMLSSLFADSEKKILKALDRGLDQFSAGKIVGLATPQPPAANQWVSISRHDAEEDEYNEWSRTQDTSTSTENAITATIERKEISQSIIDTLDSDTQNTTKPKRGIQNSNNVKSNDVCSETNSSAADKPMKITAGSGGDYAVEAARMVASKRKAKMAQGKRTPSSDKEVEKHDARPGQKSWDSPKVSTRIPPDAERKLAGPSWTISSPKKRKNTKLQAPNSLEESSSANVSEVIQESRQTDDESLVMAPSLNVVDAEFLVEKQGRSTVVDSKRKLNLKVVEDVDSKPSEPPLSAINHEDLIDKEGDSEEIRKAKEAQRMMADIAESGQDMTAEELLREVLKFGEEKKKEEEIGSGFVSGAFEKAKELLREQQQQRESRKFKEISKGDVGAFKVDIAEPEELVSKPIKELSAEEELRRIFQAGERLAESRIELTSVDERQLTVEQNQQVDSLLTQEKTISSYARTLDDELAELEVRINRNPDEDKDGPKKNKMFDVLSGPEVYNPNVDPESAVNWPGALPGRKKIRLPKELDEAVKQANFAANVIMKMREEQVGSAGKDDVTVNYFVGDRPLSHAEVLNLKTVVAEGVKLGILNDPVQYMAERSRLAIIIDELRYQPDERFRDVAENYKDLLLSNNFVDLLKEHLTEMADRDREMALNEDADNSTARTDLEQRHERERQILGQLVVYAQLLLKEARALGASLEAQQIEVIRSICKVAMDPSLVTEEETARALTDAVRDMRPLFDDVFVAYMKYAVAEEKGRLARAGVLDDPEHNQWLMVLQIVQQGVYAEIAKGINRYIEHIWYILRMETRQQRRSLLSEIIDAMPTLDVRPFVLVVDNIASSLGDAVKGETDPMVLGEMTNSLLQLHRDVHDLLPPDRINEMAKDADEWAAKQRQRLMEQRNMTKKRLQQSRVTEPIAEAILKRAAGEIERFE
ncbi:hypothetical protein MHU86_4147 [Fragilaria crotonensis]|nr:hypothetical protein MHU86_4147 [Fragilaria crotonensis]